MNPFLVTAGLIALISSAAMVSYFTSEAIDEKHELSILQSQWSTITQNHGDGPKIIHLKQDRDYFILSEKKGNDIYLVLLNSKNTETLIAISNYKYHPSKEALALVKENPYTSTEVWNKLAALSFSSSLLPEFFHP